MTLPRLISVPASLHLRPRPTLPSTEQLLLEGGDARIALDASLTANKYGCAPRPDPALLAFGSSTASVISTAGFGAADRLRQRVLIAGNVESPAFTYKRELNRMRHELIHLCGVADLPGLDVIFAASGTDLHLIATQLTGANQSKPTRVIMVDADETGRGVTGALAGCHFSHRTAQGKSVVEGASITDATPIELIQVAVRLNDGTPRTAASVDAEVDMLVSAAAEAGQRVLLILVDVSKTGMIAPSPACAAALRNRYAGSLHVMVDACQFRLAPATLHGYLEQGFMVALTGSKFLTGPTFSGALLIPAFTARRMRQRPLPRGLSAYSSRADWPADWGPAAALDSTANFGLLMRWEAALQELRAFRAVADERITHFLRTFAQAITARLQDDPLFGPLPVPLLDRGAIGEVDAWDRIPTIFPFLMFHPADGAKERRPLNRDQTMQVYRLLQVDVPEQRSDIDADLAALRCQVGQPVACGECDGVPVSALRVCASARLVVEAAATDNGDAIIQRALAALDKAGALVRQVILTSN